MDSAKATRVRHEVSLNGNIGEPLDSSGMIRDEQQIVGDVTQGVGHPVDDATPSDLFEALGGAAVPGCRATGENHTGAGKSH